MRFPFGKYANTPVDSVPSEYLSWIADKNITPALKSEIERVLAVRESNITTGKYRRKPVRPSHTSSHTTMV